MKLKSSKVSSLLFSLCLIYFLTFTVVHAGLPNPSWTANCEGSFQKCADVQVYSDWFNEKSPILTFHLDAFLRDPIDSLTVWILVDGSRGQAEEMARTLWREAEVGVVLVYPRGGYRGVPKLNCNDTTLEGMGWPSAACVSSLYAMKTDSQDNYTLDNFASIQVAKDLDHVMHSLNKNKQNLLVAQGVNAVAVLEMIKLNADRGDVGYVVSDAPYPTSFDSFESLHRFLDYALHAVLSACDREVQCMTRLGASEGTAARFKNVLQSIKDGKLPCVHELQWGSGKSGEVYPALLGLLAKMLVQSPFLLPSDPKLIAIVPSVLYRLQRCDASDVTALNRLYTYVTDYKGSARDALDLSLVLQQFNWIFNELSLNKTHTASSAKDRKKWQAGWLEEMRPVPHADLLPKLEEMYEKFPKYTEEAQKKLGSYKPTRNKLLLLLSDVDPTYALPQATGLAQLHQESLSNAVHIQTVAGSAQHPLTTRHLSCLILNVRQYKTNSRWAEASACLSDDGEGKRNDDANAAETIEYTHSSSAFNFIRVNSEAIYGVGDAWQYSVPNPAEPPGGRYQRYRWLGKLGSFLKTAIKYLFYAVVAAAVLAVLYYVLGSGSCSLELPSLSRLKFWGGGAKERPNPYDRIEINDDDDEFFARLRS